MRLPHWIGAFTLTVGLLASFGLISDRAFQGDVVPETWNSTAVDSSVPKRSTLQALRAAAEPLAYLHAMRRAVAATPATLPDGTSLQAAKVTTTSLGPLKIGMTLEEAADALGLPLVPLGRNVSGECAYYKPDTSDATIGLMVVGNAVIRVDIWPGSAISTASGIQVGSTEAEVLAQYAEQIESAPNPYTSGKVMTFTPIDPGEDLYRLVFETDGAGRVIQYRAGQFPAVTWPDGCA
ncbi:MAG: hypothetical protein O2890_02350 [Cyanobacteria bacterium]|nr:hypothetical protein [Cyanobacteriota bacterium]MDA0865257.1 hypothetical protein [Cyanobacteriota bacterium]